MSEKVKKNDIIDVFTSVNDIIETSKQSSNVSVALSEDDEINSLNIKNLQNATNKLEELFSGNCCQSNCCQNECNIVCQTQCGNCTNCKNCTNCTNAQCKQCSQCVGDCTMICESQCWVMTFYHECDCDCCGG